MGGRGGYPRAACGRSRSDETSCRPWDRGRRRARKGSETSYCASCECHRAPKAWGLGVCGWRDSEEFFDREARQKCDPGCLRRMAGGCPGQTASAATLMRPGSMPPKHSRIQTLRGLAVQGESVILSPETIVFADALLPRRRRARQVSDGAFGQTVHRTHVSVWRQLECCRRSIRAQSSGLTRT